MSLELHHHHHVLLHHSHRNHLPRPTRCSLRQLPSLRQCRSLHPSHQRRLLPPLKCRTRATPMSASRLFVARTWTGCRAWARRSASCPAA